VGRPGALDTPSIPERRHLTLLLLAALLAALAVAPAADARGTAPPSNQIVGGTLAGPGAWPAQGLLLLTTSSGTFQCGGTLVSARWFVTAGHCVTNDAGDTVLAPTAFHVTLGRSDLNDTSTGAVFTADAVIRHAQFAALPDFDVALLHLSAPAPQEPLGIVSASESALWGTGTIATIIGWGTTCATGCASTTQLREAQVPMVADSTCSADYGADFHPATMVCAGIGPTDTCQGDSGGPLMVPRQGAFVLAGITSWGVGCADRAFPGIYTRIGTPALHQWISDRIPTAAIAVSPSSPVAGDTVALTATATKPASQPGTAAFSWDLDDDGAFDDAAGATASLPAAAAGDHVVRVQESYGDGDRALARERVTVGPGVTPDPPAPQPALVTPSAPSAAAPTDAAPAAAPTAAITEPLATAPLLAPALPALAKLVGVPTRVSLASLADRRMTVRVSCSAACDLEATLRLGGPAARAAGFAPAALLGSGRARVTAPRTATVTISLSRRTARKLRRARSSAITLLVVATAGSRRLELGRLVQLRR